MARVTALPKPDEKADVVRGLFDRIAPRYDLVNRIMTFGMDRGWRRRAAATLGLTQNAVVLDVACGTGDFLNEARARGWLAAGLDFSREMLAHARGRGFTAVVQADALTLPIGDRAIDGITCGFALRNVTDLPRLFAEMARVLRSGGRVALLETATPSNAVLRAGHSVYFRRIVPFIGGVLSDRAAYAYLPQSTAYLPDAQQLCAMLRDAGFAGVARVTMSAGAVQLLVGSRA